MTFDAINVDNASHGSSSSNKSEDSETALAAEWKPTTPDEMKRYAVYSKEKAEYTVDTQNAYTIVIQNAMQGKNALILLKRHWMATQSEGHITSSPPVRRSIK